MFLKCNKHEVTSRNYPRIKTLEVSDISENGAHFNAEIIFRGDFEILHYGFVWSENNNPNLEGSDKVIYSENIQSNIFSATISSTLKEGVSYFVRSFVQTEDYVVYGNNIEFMSLGSNAPKILSFSPKMGTWGDSIRIIGKNFSYVKDNNKVLMGEISAEVLSASDSVITIKIPSVKNENIVRVSVSIAGNVSISKEDFTYIIPEITSIAPLIGTFNDTIIINGMDFGKIENYNTVKLGQVNCRIIDFSSSRIRFVVPEELATKESEITLISKGQELVYDEIFTLDPPIILSFDPFKATVPNQIITLTGKNFNPNIQFNKVLIGGRESEILEATSEMVKVILPDEVMPPYVYSRFFDVYVSITVAEHVFTASLMLEIYWHSTWTEKNGFPGSGRHNAVAFSIGAKGYFGTGIAESENNNYQLLDDFWEYDPSSDQWTYLGQFPGGPRAAASAFSIGDKGYVGLGSQNFYWDSPEKDTNHFSDFYEFDPSSKNWTKITDFQGVGRLSAASFVINDEGYIVTGDWGLDAPYGNSKSADDVWKYDPVLDQWTQMENFPNNSYHTAGFSIGNIGYIYDYNNLYKLENGNWTSLDSGIENWWDFVAFSINDKGYVGFGNDHHGGTYLLGEYDPNSIAWEKKNIDYYNQRYGASAFVIGNKAYIIGGFYNSRSLNDVWEFDPTLPEN